MSHPGNLPYAPGLDGVRALAVAAVVTYHLGTTGDGAHPLPGGFLGVDVFFVLSGYLITGLLLGEAHATLTVSIKRFYGRRARRLLPALYLLLLAVGLITVFHVPQQLGRLDGDLLAALGYGTNWWLIAQETSYFGAGGDRPALLTHLWSLAVEEQFYLVWPLVILGLTASGLRARPAMRLLLTGTVIAVLASAAAAALLYDPWGDPSRVYYGTDTRALAPLCGAALAVLLRPWRRRHPDAVRRSGRVAGAVGVLSLLGLAAVAVLLRDDDPLLYRGGFLLIAVLGAGLVAAAGHPLTTLGRVLGIAPLRWLGERSYAVYLWHWPICALTRPGLDVPLTGWAVAALRVGLTLVAAELSYRLVELPLRRDGLTGRLARRFGVPRRRRMFAPVRSAVLALVLLLGSGVVVARLWTAAQRPPVAAGQDAAPPVDLGPLPVPTPAPQPSASASPTVRPSPRHLPRVAFFGDSQGSSLILNKPRDLGKHLTASDATISGCGILRGRVTSRSGERRDLIGACPDWRSAWADKARRLKPQVAVIMAGAWDVFDLTTPQGRLVFATPSWDDAFRLVMRQGIATLRDADAQVALSLLPCYDPVRAGAGYWPERGDVDRVRHVNGLLRALAAEDPAHVFILDPPAEFCDDPKIAADRDYRWDGVHYYRKGAALYFQRVVPQLLMLP